MLLTTGISKEIFRAKFAVVPSQPRLHPTRQLASHPRQNGLAAALRELGRMARTLFTLDWIDDPELRRTTGQELNKGEARNSLARAVFLHRLGEIRDRTYENQQHRAAGEHGSGRLRRCRRGRSFRPAPYGTRKPGLLIAQPEPPPICLAAPEWRQRLVALPNAGLALRMAWPNCSRVHADA